eukprot:CAMPEP_0184681668 /NCGR_PEP_ID=MMETSP0312-20130426/4650_1 /TAXON_ID=31354 /ORGANISM="Compsopogon coeruleus, Strain SAG 36.94" /LENGTH=401 /DNA_ID=CAMNT_0027132659 /DNA_START=1367 /DNA_END=2575 /DNA_ORIENTATION=-
MTHVGKRIDPAAVLSVLHRTVDTSQRLSLCSHSCLQTLRNVCVGPGGDIRSLVDTPAKMKAAKGRIALMTPVHHGQPNSQHVLQEYGLPLMFYLGNCWDPRHKALFILRRLGVPCDDFFGKAVENVARTRLGAKVISNCSERVDHFDDDVGHCFEELRILLNPLRSNCQTDPDARNDATLSVVGPGDAQYTMRGLRGLCSAIYEERTVSSSPPQFTLARALELYQQHFHRHIESWRATPMSGSRNLAVRIINRRDASRRVSMNADALVSEVRRRYPSANIQVHDQLSRMSPIDQINVFASADIVIAVHGAAMANAIAMRPGSVLIDHCKASLCELWELPIARLNSIITEPIPCTNASASTCNDGWNTLPVVNYDINRVLEALARRFPLDTQKNVWTPGQET